MKASFLIPFLLSGFLSSTVFSETPPKVLRIGGIFDLSSAAGSQWGAAERNGFLLAIEDFKKARPEIAVVSLIEDSAYSNRKATAALHKLHSVEGVSAVVGPTWEVFTSFVPVCESEHIICLATSANNAAFHRNRPHYSFSFWFAEQDYAEVLGSAMQKSSYSRIALFADTSSYYDVLVETMKSMLKERIVFTQRFQEGERDMRTAVVKTPKDVDALAVFLLGDGTAQSFFRQWLSLRRDRPDVYTDDALLYFDPPFDLAKFSSRIFYSVPDLPASQSAAFESKHERRFGSRPQAPSGAVAYDATFILLQCMEQSEQVDKVRDCISAIQGYDGYSGSLSLSGTQSVRERRMKVLELQ